ncbi:hypothetical protein ACJJIU_12155 [Microbulbifer sp. CnH-101-E]|jgi:hypothetical protein|uniref:hypothetical protein n=2 Tax=unclassified Microbulbifer TaxID=2619833 RepID=UPI004038FCC6
MMKLEEDVVDAIESGQMIQAMKLLREYKNINLKEARIIVNTYVREKNIQSSPTELPGRAGLIGLLLLLAITGYLAFGLGAG